MKKLTALLLTAIMLCSICAIATSATGEIIFSDSFDSGFTPKNWITKGNLFTWDKENRCIHGYRDAVVVESFYGSKGGKWWDKFYVGVDFQIRGFDDSLPEHEEELHYVALWYNDLFENAHNSGDNSLRGANYMYHVDTKTGKATLVKTHTWSYYDANGIRQNISMEETIAEAQLGNLIEVGEDAPWYNIGMRVTEGKIECYFNEELIMSSSAADGKESVGGVFLDAVDATVGTEKSAVVLWNLGHWLAFDNFEVWTPDYDFVPGPAYVYGDVNSDGNVNLSDISMMLQAIAKWEIEGYNAEAGDVNGDGAVNLSDVSKTLQAIAKWEGVVLGPLA